MAKSSRTKGKRGELEVAAVFTDAGLTAHREAPLQAGVDGVADVRVREYPELHVESKRCETYRLPAWQRQADEAAEASGETPIIAYRRNGTPKAPEPWRAAVRLDWLAATLAELDNLRRFREAQRILDEAATKGEGE